jgi:MFS family permease
MWTSVFTEHIGFCVWSLWSVLVLFMSKKTGYALSAGDKFLLASIVTLVGSAVRPLYGYAVTRLGGRTWTTISAIVLLVPVIGATVLMGYPRAPFAAFAACAAVSGIGGGSFASSTTNINFFFPQKEKGRALGINAGAGNLGVATVQLLGLLVIATAGIAQPRLLAVIFVPLLVLAAAISYLTMDNLPGMRTGGADYAKALRNPYTWIISLLYIGTFGSFIGYSFAFGLVLTSDFGRTPLQAAALTFIGPLIGSLIRPVRRPPRRPFRRAAHHADQLRGPRRGHRALRRRLRRALAAPVHGRVRRAVRAVRPRQRRHLRDDLAAVRGRRRAGHRRGRGRGQRAARRAPQGGSGHRDRRHVRRPRRCRDQPGVPRVLRQRAQRTPRAPRLPGLLRGMRRGHRLRPPPRPGRRPVPRPRGVRPGGDPPNPPGDQAGEAA